MIPTSWYSCSCVTPPLECGLDLVMCFQQMEYVKSDKVSLPRLGYKTLWLCLASTLSLAGTLSCPLACSPDETNCHVWEALWIGPRVKELREASCQQLMRNWGPSPTTREELNPANNHMSVSLEVDPAQSVFEMTATCERAWSRGCY